MKPKAAARTRAILLASLFLSGCSEPVVSGTDIALENVPRWAFAFPDRNIPNKAESAGPKTLPGSSKTYSEAQINDLKNPPDWFPESHPTMPPAVAGGGEGLACASCHLTSGMGHPHNAALAGQPASYLERQIAEFRSGARRNPIVINGKPENNSLQFMIEIARNLSPEDAKSAAAYFASLKPQPWIKVVETAIVPRTYVSVDYMRTALPGTSSEPLGNRIVELAQDPERHAMRDPRSGTVAYVPLGSVVRGKKLVEGAQVPCQVCHGPELNGAGDIPSIRGRSPTSVFRQLYLFKSGDRNGAMAGLMKSEVASMTQADMIDVAAYLATLPP